MQRYVKLSFIALFWLCSGYCPAQQLRYKTLTIRKVQLRRDERIIGIELHIIAGGFDRVDSIPMGWSFDIDNDPSWQTNLGADIQVGAAAIDAKSLQKIGFRIVKNKFGGLKFHMAGTVIVTIDFLKERRIELSAENFSLK